MVSLINNNNNNQFYEMDSSTMNYRSPVFSRQTSTSSMTPNSSQFTSPAPNWFASSAGYYHHHNGHSYHHHHHHHNPHTNASSNQVFSIMQSSSDAAANQPCSDSWSAAAASHLHQHQYQNFDWIPQLTNASHCQMEYSTEDSDISPSPISNRTLSPGYLQSSNIIRSKSPYEWMRKTTYQSEPSPGKTRTKDKYRVVYTDQQRLELEKEFHFSKYITIKRKSDLASGLGLSERQVKIWFQNRRAKERKQAKKRQETICKTEPILNQSDRIDHLTIL